MNDDDDYDNYIEQFNHVIPAPVEAKKPGGRTVQKYQKSKSRTVDLSDAIFDMKDQSEKSPVTNYDLLIEEYGIDSKLNPENAIIKSTLSNQLCKFCLKSLYSDSCLFFFYQYSNPHLI
jgi:hypothetical protein